MEARLATSVLVSGLIRQVSGQGGFGTVLHKGDEVSGSILVILAERGEQRFLVERLLQPDASYAWQASSPGSDAIDAAVARRRRVDPDLWVVELDVASAERFAAEMNASH